MPFKSYAQASYLKHNNPDVYNRWVEKYGAPKDVPQRVKKTSYERAMSRK